MAARYRRVSQTEPDEQESNKKLRAERIEKITAKLHSLLWMILAAFIIYFTDLINLIQDPSKINRYC
jgi:hypothetical protein